MRNDVPRKQPPPLGEARVTEADQDEANNPTYCVRIAVGSHEVDAYVTYYGVKAGTAAPFVRVTRTSHNLSTEGRQKVCNAVWARIEERGVGK